MPARKPRDEFLGAGVVGFKIPDGHPITNLVSRRLRELVQVSRHGRPEGPAIALKGSLPIRLKCSGRRRSVPDAA